MIMYALRHKPSGKLLGIIIESVDRDAELCGNYIATLTLSTENIWVITSLEQAMHVRDNDTEWYNAGYRSPQNQFVGMCEVVSLALGPSVD